MAIESVMHESRIFQPPKEFSAKARLGSMAAYQAMCNEADKNYAEFWAKHAPKCGALSHAVKLDIAS